jgi:hypothetical protein
VSFCEELFVIVHLPDWQVLPMPAPFQMKDLRVNETRRSWLMTNRFAAFERVLAADKLAVGQA